MSDRPDYGNAWGGHGATGQTRNELTSQVVPTIGQQLREVVGNESWSGKKIVPERYDKMDDVDKFIRFQMPYIADQLTNRMFTDPKPPWKALDATNVPPGKSLDDFKDQFGKMDAERNKSVTWNP